MPIFHTTLAEYVESKLDTGHTTMPTDQLMEFG